MPYILNPQADEQILLDIRYEPSAKSEAFHFAVTNQAVYLPATKFVLSGDARYFQRVPHAEVKEVSVQKAKAYGAWIAAVLLIAAGLVLVVSQMMAGFAVVDTRFLGWAAALIIGGALLPRAAKGRERLVVVMSKSVFRWNPPFVVDRKSKEQVQAILQSILDTCQTNGVPTSRQV